MGQYQAQFGAFIAIARRYISKHDYTYSLLLFENNYPVLPTQLKQLTSKFHLNCIQWFSALLFAGKANAIFQFKGPIEDKAIAIIAALHGAMTMSELSSIAAYDATVSQIKYDLGLRL